MPSLAITGNVGSGKSAVLDDLTHLLHSQGCTVTRYSADEENGKLLERDPDVRTALVSAFGKEFLDDSGLPDRTRLAGLIKDQPDAKTCLEEILHPRLEAQWVPWPVPARAPENNTSLRKSLSFLKKTCIIISVPL